MQKLTHFIISNIDIKFLWGDLEHRPHNLLAVGAIAPIIPMESASMAAIWWRQTIMFSLQSVSKQGMDGWME